MNNCAFFVHLIVVCIANFILGDNTPFTTSKTSAEQLVKTCCGNREGFDVIAGHCISLKNISTVTSLKVTKLYPYLGSWKRKKTPRFLHVAPVCGYENYEILGVEKKIALNRDYIEISQILRESPEVITSFIYGALNITF